MSLGRPLLPKAGSAALMGARTQSVGTAHSKPPKALQVEHSNGSWSRGVTPPPPPPAKTKLLNGAHRPCTVLGGPGSRIQILIFRRTLLVITSIFHLLGRKQKPQPGRELVQALGSVVALLNHTTSTPDRQNQSQSTWQLGHTRYQEQRNSWLPVAVQKHFC